MMPGEFEDDERPFRNLGRMMILNERNMRRRMNEEEFYRRERHIRPNEMRRFEEEEDMINSNENELNDNIIYFEDIIKYPKKLFIKNEEEDLNIIPLSKYKEININKLKEDIFYYCSSPETLMKLSPNINDAKNYEFYHDLNSDIFSYSQKAKNNILSDKNIQLKSLIKPQKLSNYNDTLCIKLSEPPDTGNVQEKKSEIKNANLIINKIEEILLIYKEKNENEILEYLTELEKLIGDNKIEMKIIGFVLYNSIQNNLCMLLNIIMDEFNKKENNEDIMKKFGNIFKGIYENFKSIKLLFLFIKFCHTHQNILEHINIDTNKPNQFISEDSLNFTKIYNEDNFKYKIFINFNQFLKDKEILNKMKNEDLTDLCDYYTLNKDDNLFIFLNYPKTIVNLNKNEEKSEDEKEENNKEDIKEEINNKKEKFNKGNILYYLKINLIEKKVNDSGKIELFKNDNIIDLNISIKNEFIYIFSIIEINEKDIKKYNLNCKIYIQNTMCLLNEKTIELKDTFIPIKLFNDNKYIYCVSSSNEVLIIQKKYKLNYQNYIKYSIQINEGNQLTNINNLNSYKMYNSLSINNMFVIENKDNNKYLAKFSNKDKDEYLLYITQLNNNQDNKEIKLTFNDNRFVITKFIKNIIFFNITNKEENNLIDKGIFLLPFNSNNYNNNSKGKNIYEYLLQQYSSFLNTYGNFDLLNNVTEHNLIYSPFTYCNNFYDYNIDFIIKNIKENNENDKLNIKLYYLIILKQIICSLYNSGIFKEDKVKDLINYLKEYIISNVKENNNSMFNKILKEVISIISYFNEYYIIDVNDIENIFKENYNNINNKTKMLLIELLLEQKKTQKNEKLYEILIEFDKNYLINIFKNINEKKDIEIPLYSLFIKLMKKASEIYFTINIKEMNEYNKLTSLINSITSNIQELLKLYISIYSNKEIKMPLHNFSFLYNSLNIRLFYYIIQKIITDKIFIKKDDISKIYDILLLLDNNNINNNYDNILDMNNIIEIKSSSLRHINNNINVPVELNEPKKIIINTSLTSNNKLNELIKIILTKKNNDKYKINLYKDQNIIFDEIKKIEINFLNGNQDMKRDFVINIIPLKDEKNYLSYLKNEDNKILSLIQKSIIFCLLNLLDPIQNKINNYNNEQIIKNHSLLYQYDIFKNISISNINENEKIEEISTSDKTNNNKNPIIEKSNDLINEINKLLGFNIKEESLRLFKEEKEKKKQGKKEENIINEKYDKLLKCFEYDISKKNLPINKIKANDNIKYLIIKIFEISIKHYNYKEKIEKLIKDIESIYKDDIDKIINDINLLENYKVLYSLYEASYKIKTIYINDKNGFDLSKIEEESNNYINNNLSKLEFINNVIVPNNEKENTIPNTSIIDDILNLLKILKDIDIEEIKIYYKVQNISCDIISNELELINKLLTSLKKEENIIFLLYLMNNKIRQMHNKGKPIFDNIYGADYYLFDEIKCQFHDILKKINDKIKENEKNKYSITTHITLLESLIWKIKERDFDLIYEIMNIFEQIKHKNENNDKNVFIFENKDIYSIKYLNEGTKNIKIREIFELIMSQVISIINDNINNGIESKHSKLIKNILSYYKEITEDNEYYHDFILFFYKNIINSNKLLSILLTSYYDIIKKIMNISLSNNDNLSKKDILTKLIMIKLLYQILKNMEKKQMNNLVDCCKLYDDKFPNEKNPLVYIYELIYTKLNNNHDNEKIINNYYIRILIICLNKLLEFEDNNKIIKELINDKIVTIISLFSNNSIGISENNFMTKPSFDKDFEDIALFISEDDKFIQTGKIICFLSNENNKSIVNYLSDESIINFDKNNFEYYTEDIENNDNNNNDAYIIMDDTLESELYTITSTEIKPISDIIISDDNNLQKAFIKNNIKLIIEIINKEFNLLNEKGIYLTLKILSNVINYIGKEDLINIMNNILKYYFDNKNKENKYVFLSLEFIEEKINKMINKSCSNNKDIYKEKDNEDNKSPTKLINLFNYYIKNETFGLCLLSRNKIKWYNNVLEIPINKEENKSKFKEIYNNNNKYSNLSFYKSHKLYVNEIITDDSILFTESIENTNTLEYLVKIINDKKVKVIFTKEFKVQESELEKFIIDNKIPVYIIRNNAYQKFIDFFIEGIGGNYIDINTNENTMENSSSIVDIFKLNYNTKEYYKNKKDKRIIIKNDIININSDGEMETEDKLLQYNENIENIKENPLKQYEKKRNKKYTELIDDIQSFYCLGNIKIIQRFIYDIICLDLIKLEELQLTSENIEKLVYIIEVLCMEYYFNISNSIPNQKLKPKLNNYLKKMSNEWMKIYFNKYIDDINQNNIKSLKYTNYLSLYDINRYNSEIDLMDNNSYLFKDVLYDKLLFILKECLLSNNKEVFVNQYFDIIKKIIEKLLNKKKRQFSGRFYNKNSDDDDDDSENDNKNKSKKENFQEIFVYNVLNILYEYLINNCNKENAELIKKCFIDNNIQLIMKQLIEDYLNMEEYFNEKEKKEISQKETLLIQISFKYLDFCLIFFFRENQQEYLEYWLKTKNLLFTFYCNYKLLSIEKYYEKNDYKEIFSLIAYICDSINCFDNQNNTNNNKNNNNKNFEMRFNELNKYIANIEEDDFITTFDIGDSYNIKEKDKLKVNYKKLAVFCLDKNNKEKEEKYILQDIIDINELKRRNISYKIKLNKEIYLVPLNDIPTYLYAFGYNYNHSLGINGSLSKFYDTPKKCSGLPKYSWNISYGQNYCLSLDEENYKVYACGCGKGGGFNSIPRKEFTLETNINKIDNNKENKIIDFATGNSNTSLLLNQNGEIFAIGSNQENFLRLNREKNSIKYPLKLSINLNIKVVSMSISDKNCYIINNLGELYGVGDNSRSQIIEDPDEEIERWTKIPLPDGCRRFLQCTNGERYLICLVEDDKGKGRLYSRGYNTHNECGIKGNDKSYITKFTQCDETQNLNFKYISTRNNRSAAITMDGELYIWGKKCESNKKKGNDDSDDDDEKGESITCPTLVRYNSEYEKVIIDQVAISKTHIIAIGRSLKNGNYYKKLFSCGNNKKGALGIKMNSLHDKNMSEILSEVEIIDEENKNSKLIPIKVSAGNNRSFVLCVDENELIEKIKNKKINNYLSFEIKISHFIEENIFEKIQEFYKSNNLNKFINIFRSLTYQCYKGFVDAMDEMKTEHNIMTSYIYYNEFLNYLSRNKTHDLFVIFNNNENTTTIYDSESIFNYLKTKIMVIENNIMTYCATNMRSVKKEFLHKIIGNNISYLPNILRINKFNDLIMKIERKNGEIKTIKVDRFKAKSFYDKYNENNKKISDLEFNETIFGQVFQEMKNIDSQEYFLDKGKRLFIVCLQAEHASDSGGPYHEVLSNICDELENGYIDLLIKTPNNRSDYDQLNDKYILNPNSNRKLHNEAYEFLGKLMASSISSGEALDLNLHPCIWKSILGNEINFYDYETIDFYFYNLIRNLEEILKLDNKKIEDYDLNFVIKNSNGTDIELKPNGSMTKVNLENLKEYIDLCKEKRIKEFNNQIYYIKKGFNSVISNDILQVLNWTQLEELVCGKIIFDIDDFKDHTKYEGFDINDETIKWFWEWFEQTDENNRFKYLKFVSGRSRLPKSGLGFKYKHIISKAFRENKNNYPTSTTCFFKLNLPIYDNKEIFIDKMQYAIINCTEIDTDQ